MTRTTDTTQTSGTTVATASPAVTVSSNPQDAPPGGADTPDEGAPSLQVLDALLRRDERPAPPSGLSASLTFGWRAMLKIKHVPEQLFDVTGFPIIMTLMFTFLFGGALAGSTSDYAQFLVPGIMVISVVMITMYTGTAVSNDIQKGVFDRFRTLPIWRPAPMVGYLLGDAVRYAIAAVVIIGVGMALGYRPAGGVIGVLAGIGLLVLFSFAFSWIWTMLGLVMRSEKSLMGLSQMILFPLAFLSNVFVDPDTMPGWLRVAVQVNPVTILVDQVRDLMAGTPDVAGVMVVLIVSAVLVVVFGSITMRLYNRV
jgi:ABC-2 type transport system permease protein